jgi:hypothetical protein
MQIRLPRAGWWRTDYKESREPCIALQSLRIVPDGGEQRGSANAPRLLILA